MRKLSAIVVISIALFGSAYSNLTKKATIRYYYTMNKDISLYVRFGMTNPGEEMCVAKVFYPSCIIAFSTDQGPIVDPFFMPTLPIYTSQIKGYYLPGPIKKKQR